MIDDVGGGTAGAWDKGTWDNVNPLGPLDGGTAGGRVLADIRVSPPMAWGRLEALEAVADAARDVVPFTNTFYRYEAGRRLADALDALDVEV